MGAPTQYGRNTLPLTLLDHTNYIIPADPNDEYFADGLTEELITVLSQVKELQIVSDQLRIILGSAEENRIAKRETANVVAHVACLKGRTLLDSRMERGIRDAQEQFKFALKHDPNYARAYAGLADVYSLLADHRYARASESLTKSRSFVTKALELDANIAEAHASYGLLLHISYLFVMTENKFQKAIALNPSYATAHH